MDTILSFLISDLWIVRILFILYLFNVLYKITKTYIYKESRKIKKSIIFYHLFNILISLLMIIRPEFFGAAIVIIITYFIVNREDTKIITRFPLVGDIAKVAMDMKNHFEENQEIVNKHFNARGLQRFTLFTKDKDLKQWRKDSKIIISRHTSNIVKWAIIMNLIVGITLYLINGSLIIDDEKIFHLSSGVLSFIFGIFFASIQAVAMGLFAGLFVSGLIGNFIELRYAFIHQDPNLLKYL